MWRCDGEEEFPQVREWDRRPAFITKFHLSKVLSSCRTRLRTAMLLSLFATAPFLRSSEPCLVALDLPHLFPFIKLIIVDEVQVVSHHRHLECYILMTLVLISSGRVQFQAEYNRVLKSESTFVSAGPSLAIWLGWECGQVTASSLAARWAALFSSSRHLNLSNSFDLCDGACPISLGLAALLLVFHFF